MLGTPSIQRYQILSQRSCSVVAMIGDNPPGADNQQERPGIEQWVTGFVDGEGCFSISVVRNSSCRLGWQVQHEFSITQASTSLRALELVAEVFGCGRILINRRHDDHRSDLARFSVKRRQDLWDTVIPFFERNPLRTSKAYDFEMFRSVIAMMRSGRHLVEEGLADIARITERMNRRAKSRYLESSEAIRRPSSLR